MFSNKTCEVSWGIKKNIILARTNFVWYPSFILPFPAPCYVLRRLTHRMKSCRLPGPLAFIGVKLMESTSRILKNRRRNRLVQGFSDFKMPTSYLGIFLKCKFWFTRADLESITLHFYQTPGWFLLMLWKLLCKWQGLGYFPLFCLFPGLCILALAASTPLWQWFSTLGIHQNNLRGFWKPSILATSQILEISGGETQCQ